MKLTAHFASNEFGLVVSLFNSFGYFGSRRDDVRMLKAVHRVLKPGGAFVVNTLNGRGGPAAEKSDLVWHRTATERLHDRSGPLRCPQEADIQPLDHRGRQTSRRIFSALFPAERVLARGAEDDAMRPGSRSRRHGECCRAADLLQASPGIRRSSRGNGFKAPSRWRPTASSARDVLVLEMDKWAVAYLSGREMHLAPARQDRATRTGARCSRNTRSRRGTRRRRAACSTTPRRKPACERGHGATRAVPICFRCAPSNFRRRIVYRPSGWLSSHFRDKQAPSPGEPGLPLSSPRMVRICSRPRPALDQFA